MCQKLLLVFSLPKSWSRARFKHEAGRSSSQPCDHAKLLPIARRGKSLTSQGKNQEASTCRRPEDFGYGLGEDGYQGIVSMKARKSLEMLILVQRFARSGTPPKWCPREKTKLHCCGWGSIEGSNRLFASYYVDYRYEEPQSVGLVGVQK